MITNKKSLILGLFISLTLSLTVKSGERSDDMISAFVLGDYQLIGKALNSDETYLGQISFNANKENMTFTKTINNQQVTGSVTIEMTDADKIKVIRLRFESKNIPYEQTCLMNSDLDNYARLTCHLYPKDEPTNNPGLEAMFIKH